jgi:phosphatidylserine decarboxylase
VRSYLPSRYNTWTFIILFILLVFKKFDSAIILFSIYLAVYFILRKHKNNFRDDPMVTKGVVFSPCNGKIIHVEKNISHVSFGDNLIEVQIMIPWWKEMGIFMPITSEVKTITVHKGRSFFRFFKAAELVGTSIGKGLSIALFSFQGEKFGMTLYKCRLGLWPDIILMPGDKGSRRVNIGYLPFGGTLLLYLPENYEILVKENNQVVAGESILAILPGA